MEADTMLAWQIAPYMAMVWLAVTLAFAGVCLKDWARGRAAHGRMADGDE
jgi:hypothetical protein